MDLHILSDKIVLTEKGSKTHIAVWINDTAAKKKKQRQVINLKTKMEIIKGLGEGERAAQIAVSLGLKACAIKLIKRNAEKIGSILRRAFLHQEVP